MPTRTREAIISFCRFSHRPVGIPLNLIILKSIDVGSKQLKMDPQWLSQRGFWGISNNTMAKYRWNHRFGQWLHCFKETFTPWELGLGTASHTRKMECECLEVWFQMLSFNVWVWARATMTMDWMRGKEWVEGEAESGSCAREREKKKMIIWKFTQTYQKQWAGWNSGRTMKFFKGKIVFLLFGEVSKI